jgi:hypothetical protein
MRKHCTESLARRCRASRRHRNRQSNPSDFPEAATGLAGDIGERAVAVIAIQNVGDAGVIIGMTVSPAARFTLAAEAVIGETPLQVARDKNIEPAIIVEIEEAGAGTPPVGSDARSRRYVGKGAITVIS